MATFASLEGTHLEKVDPQLEANEQEHRMMYVLTPLVRKLAEELPNWESDWEIELSPMQQLDALLEIFCSGDVLTFDRRFKPLNHLGEGIWEIKTPDLRLFGWFFRKDVFVLSCIDTAFNVKSYGLYPGWCGDAVRQRNSLPLDDPKFVAGEDPYNVVSNLAFP